MQSQAAAEEAQQYLIYDIDRRGTGTLVSIDTLQGHATAEKAQQYLIFGMDRRGTAP